MHMHAKCDQNIQGDLGVMNIFTNCSQRVGQTDIVIIVQAQGSSN